MILELQKKLINSEFAKTLTNLSKRKIRDKSDFKILLCRKLRKHNRF